MRLDTRDMGYGMGHKKKTRWDIAISNSCDECYFKVLIESARQPVVMGNRAIVAVVVVVVVFTLKTILVSISIQYPLVS